ncbi:hypothetical protein JHK85_010284 [Glycine max]|nr:hypothetical protein JHK85_010284 [Glycine max]
MVNPLRSLLDLDAILEDCYHFIVVVLITTNQVQSLQIFKNLYRKKTYYDPIDYETIDQTIVEYRKTNVDVLNKDGDLPHVFA